jgi:F0F1-type ATP synthase membrane subunit b/b'
MSLFGFEKETLLDLTVNMIPLGILLFFIAAFAVVPAFGVDPVFSTMQFALVGSMFVLLAVLSYYTGKAIEGAEEQAEEHGE